MHLNYAKYLQKLKTVLSGVHIYSTAFLICCTGDVWAWFLYCIIGFSAHLQKTLISLWKLKPWADKESLCVVHCCLLVPYPMGWGMDGQMDRLKVRWTQVKQYWTGLTNQACSVAPCKRRELGTHTNTHTHISGAEFAQALSWLDKER